MTGVRLVVGTIVMGIAIPIMLFFLLGLERLSQLFTIAISTFLAWGVAEMGARLLERPRLKDRTPGGAIREDWERRSQEER